MTSSNTRKIQWPNGSTSTIQASHKDDYVTFTTYDLQFLHFEVDSETGVMTFYFKGRKYDRNGK